jgi:C-terminal processing protease CtpA/Prc
VEEMFLRRLSANTLWLRVPDFNDRRSAPLKALLADNAETLNTTHNLVLDLRKNGGGSDYVYAPLIALAYTRPMVSIGVELRASVDNITLRRDALDKVKDSAVTVAQIEAEIKLMEKNLGQYVQPGALPFEIRREKEVRAFPRRIAVLIDGAGSTGEQLLLDLRQSAKVTLMGQRNSAGVLDFANVVGLVTPSGRFGVQWATSRSLRLPNDPVDPDGIPPDVRIPAKVLDPVSYARQWLEKQPP